MSDRKFSPNIHLVESLDDIVEFTNWLGRTHENNIIGLDIETTGLDWYSDDFKVRMLQVGDENDGWAFKVDGYEAIVKSIIERWDGEWAIHNASYDVKVLQKHMGWTPPWERIHDTMIMKYLMEPGKPAALKDSATRLISPVIAQGEKYLKEDMKKGGWTWATVPFSLDSYWQYGALDPSITVAMYNKMKPLTIDAMPEVYELEMAVLRACVNMEYKGMRIDADYVKEQYTKHQQHLDKVEKFLISEWGFKPSQKAKLADFLLAHGAEFSRFSEKTGAPSTDKEQMKLFKESGDPALYAIANTVMRYQDLQKTTGTYLKGYLTDSPYNGRLHANINTLRAKTGRMSSSNPNLQNLPSKAKLIKDAFIPDDPANQYLLSCDYSSMELRMLTNLSKDPDLIEAYRKVDEHGEDFFVNIAKLVYNEPDFQKSDPRRKLIKGYLYGTMYGAGPEKSAETAGITLEEALELDTKFKTMYPGIVNFMNEAMQTGERTLAETGQPFVTFPSGRRIPADKDEDGRYKIYALTNYILQGRSAEETKKAVVRLEAEGFDMRMVVHDEVIFHIDKADEEEARRQVEDVMTVRKSEDYPVWIPAESDPGLSRWGDKY